MILASGLMDIKMMLFLPFHHYTILQAVTGAKYEDKSKSRITNLQILWSVGREPVDGQQDWMKF